MSRSRSTSCDFLIQGGSISLQSLIPWKKKWLPSIKKKKILYLEQLITQGKYLIDYHDFKLKVDV